MLSDMEEKLYQNRDKKWKPQTFSQRTWVTRFGDVVVSRRLYKSKKKYRFLLDEYLNWQSYHRATPSLKSALVELSTQCSFRLVSGTMEKLLAGVPQRQQFIAYSQKYPKKPLKVRRRLTWLVLSKGN